MATKVAGPLPAGLLLMGPIKGRRLCPTGPHATPATGPHHHRAAQPPLRHSQEGHGKHRLPRPPVPSCTRRPYGEPATLPLRSVRQRLCRFIPTHTPAFLKAFPYTAKLTQYTYPRENGSIVPNHTTNIPNPNNKLAYSIQKTYWSILKRTPGIFAGHFWEGPQGALSIGGRLT